MVADFGVKPELEAVRGVKGVKGALDFGDSSGRGGRTGCSCGLFPDLSRLRDSFRASEGKVPA